MSTPTLLRARWVCPMNRPPIRDGGVVIADERIEAVDDASIRLRFANATTIDLGDAALLPGLINAHTHLELATRPRIEFNGDIASWLLRQRPPTHASPEQHRAEIETATRAGIEQCLQFGVTCVGDISQQPQWTRPMLARSPLRATSFGEVLGVGQLRERIGSMIERAANVNDTGPRVRCGISPHATYTVEPADLLRCVQRAQKDNLPLAMHVAEFSQEQDFLKHQSGIFRDLWEQTGLWDEQACEEFDGLPEPITYCDMFHVLEDTNLLAHVNYADDHDLSVLGDGKASVVFCPRTHAYFRHPPHRWRDMLAAGINVAVGTDSCASSPDLNIVDDLRLLRRSDPTIPIGLLWSLVTTRAAAALGQSDQVGDLAPGKAADFSVFPVTTDLPLEEILDRENCNCQATWIAGQKVF